MNQHYHAELIKAWADGAQIECLNCHNKWVDCPEPFWLENVRYRIKGKDIVVFYTVSPTQFASTTNNFLAHPNLKLTFDCNTNKLKKAEVI